MLRSFLAFASLFSASALLAETPPVAVAAPMIEPAIQERLAGLAQHETELERVRADLAECREGCTTPSEAVLLAYRAGVEGERPGRFLLDIRSGGQSLFGNLDRLYFINSRQDYGEFGTLTIAFEEDVLQALLRRARACGGGEIVNGAIQVKGCRREGLADVNMFTMMQRLNNRRILVEGDVRLQWIDARFGLQSPVSNRRGEHERGYFQPWVWVYDADQISFVYEE
ncbi:MAG: hypothetical protein QNI87_13500 [Erythrobacter sp.]|uniref:hypothetical protein n=1 Tax=Erythrobacter sp. TaxID=1042 RepID=UPI0026387F8F|nr:hypothetical protein [Erythrobacter sp.]MDJ0979537.1 hypothetical protein [Erythrobacter sp.]